jgi:hypothetical protein
MFVDRYQDPAICCQCAFFSILLPHNFILISMSAVLRGNSRLYPYILEPAIHSRFFPGEGHSFSRMESGSNETGSTSSTSSCYTQTIQ